MLRKGRAAHHTPINKDAWEAYLHEHFCAPSNSCPSPHRAAAGSCPESHTENTEARLHNGSVETNSTVPAASPSHFLDTWEQGSMGSCPESATAGHRGIWDTISRGAQSVVGALRGVAQRVTARWTGNAGASARDMAIPLGRNHPPPEVLFQQGARTGWMPEPDVLELPEASDLYPVVCGFMRKLNVRASPGFDCIAAPFIKYAEKEVPAANGRGVEKMNVLAPYFAQFFALMMEKAQIPESWNATKITPLHKKGPVLNPGNYRMVAVSGTIYGCQCSEGVCD